MTINILSDLHCRNKSFPPSFKVDELKPADVLVMAGDLAVGTTYQKIWKKLRDETKGKFREVICIRGNHDYYITDPHWLRHHGTPALPGAMDNYVVPVDTETDKVAFVCSPMWSPIEHPDYIASVMNDYRYIPGFTPPICTELFWNNLDWIRSSVRKSREEGRKVVIVTHHLPDERLIDGQYLGNDANEAFCVLHQDGQMHLRELKPDLWIHGHSHNFMDVTLDGVRYVRNPYGYEWPTHDYGETSRESTGFRMNYIVTV